jgi:hypothetical protein
MKWVAKSLAAVGLMTAMVSAQSDMEKNVSKLGASAGKAYMAPIVSGFGANMNAGWYHKAPKATKLGINIEAGAIFMGTWLSGGSKTMNVSGPMTLDTALTDKLTQNVSTTGGARDSVRKRLYGQEVEAVFLGPTVIGSSKDTLRLALKGQDIVYGTNNSDTVSVNDTVTIQGVTGVLGNFTDIPLPLFAPQLTLGTIYGTNVTLRWLPEYEPSEDIGKIKFFGFGVQHNPAVWGFMPPLPVDLSVGYFTQTLKVGSLFEASSQAFGVNASKQFGFRFLNVTPYGGVQFESSEFKFAYEMDVDGQPVPVKFTLDGENNYRATVGASFRLLAINLNADYNFGAYNSFSVGVMVGL